MGSLTHLERKGVGARGIFVGKPGKLHIAAGLVTNALNGIGTLLDGWAIPRAVHASQMRAGRLNSSQSLSRASALTEKDVLSCARRIT